MTKIHKDADFIDFNMPSIWRAAKLGDFAKEAGFIDHAIQTYSPSARRIIDIGCGSGDHLDILTQKGYETLGVDLNPRMIEYARSLFPHLEFDLGNMRDYTSNQKFDVLTCLCTTFCRNETNEEIVQTLHCFSDLLDNNGLLFIDVFNPIYFFKEGMPSEFDYNHDAFAAHNLNSIVSMRVNNVTQCIDCVNNVRNLETNEPVAAETYAFRLFFPQETRFFLEQCGFRLISFYGDFDLQHKKLDQNRLIFLAQKL